MSRLSYCCRPDVNVLSFCVVYFLKAPLNCHWHDDCDDSHVECVSVVDCYDSNDFALIDSDSGLYATY